MEQIKKYFPKLSDKQVAQFGQLKALYESWNAKINVISRKDIDNLYRNHVLHSLSISQVVVFEKDTQIIDVGTGGGFPGIPLAILYPEARFHLIDSIRKKIQVVEAVIRSLELKNASAQQIRSNELRGKYDFVVSRAVTALPKFVQDTKHLLKKQSFNKIKNGILYLKGGNIDAEIAPFSKRTSLFPIKKYFGDAYFDEKYVIYLSVE